MAILFFTKGQQMYLVSSGNAQISQYLRTCDILVNSYHCTKGWPYTKIQIHIYKSNNFQIQRLPQNSRNYFFHEKMQTNTFPHQCHCAILPKSNAHSSLRLHSLKSRFHSQDNQLNYTFALSLTKIQTFN